LSTSRTTSKGTSSALSPIAVIASLLPGWSCDVVAAVAGLCGADEIGGAVAPHGAVPGGGNPRGGGVRTSVTDSAMGRGGGIEGGGSVTGERGGRALGNDGAGGGTEPPRRLLRPPSAICAMRSISTSPSGDAYGASACAKACTLLKRASTSRASAQPMI
jgi:hypothetical protein